MDAQNELRQSSDEQIFLTEEVIANRAAYIVRIARNLLVENIEGVLPTSDLTEQWNPKSATYSANWRTHFPALGIGTADLTFTPAERGDYRLLVTSVIPDFNEYGSSSGVETDETMPLGEWEAKVRQMPSIEERRAENIQLLESVAETLRPMRQEHAARQREDSSGRDTIG